MYLKLTNFLYNNLNLLSEKNCKKQVQMFYQNHSTLYTVEIFSNSVLRKIILLGLEKSQTTLLSSLGSDWLYDIMDLNLKNTWTTLLDTDWFYDILDLELKNTWTNLMEYDWF